MQTLPSGCFLNHMFQCLYYFGNTHLYNHFLFPDNVSICPDSSWPNLFTSLTSIFQCWQYVLKITSADCQWLFGDLHVCSTRASVKDCLRICLKLCKIMWITYRARQLQSRIAWGCMQQCETKWIIDYLWKSRGLHSVNACGCSAE